MEAIAANAIGVLLYPLVWAQFAKASHKWQFLAINFLSCSIFAASFALAGTMTPALVSLAAGFTGLAQSALEKNHFAIRTAIALISISIALWLAFPQDAIGWVSVAIFAWVRVAESTRHNVMRVMYIASPAVWGLLALHAGTYSIIPADLLALFFAIRWVVLNLGRNTALQEETGPLGIEAAYKEFSR
jgi:hypothetical protein